MVKINQEATTLTGESVTPYLMENGYIYCWDTGGKTVVKRLDDFKKTVPTIKERIASGSSVVAITPVYNNVVKPPQTVEVEVSRPTIEENIITDDEIATTVQSITDGPTAVLVSPDETEDEKITYVHVKPAVDDNLFDGELQVGGVEVVEPEEAEGRTEFIPVIDDEDYI